MNVNNISLSHLVWYLVPGLCATAFFIFPIGVFYPQALKAFIGAISPFGLIFIGILLGFILDGLRLYRVRKGYNAIKKDFFTKLTGLFGLDERYDPYFVLSIVNDHAAKDKNTKISFYHAVWIMHGEIAVLFIINALVWAIIACFTIFHNVPDSTIFILKDNTSKAITSICFVFAALFLAIGIRIKNISTEGQKTTNNMFLGYALSNKSAIKNILADSNH